jgi:hypothetical protein
MTERDGEHVPRPEPERGASLVCRVATRLCAMPVGAMIETMRPLALEPIAGAPPFIAGLAVLIVLDTARMVPPAVFELVERAAS